MSKLNRILLPVGVMIAMAVVGIFMGRLVRGADDVPAPSSNEAVAYDDLGELLLADEFEGTGRVGPADVLPAPDRVVPLLMPSLTVDASLSDAEVEAALLAPGRTLATITGGEPVEAGDADSNGEAAAVTGVALPGGDAATVGVTAARGFDPASPAAPRLVEASSTPIGPPPVPAASSLPESTDETSEQPSVTTASDATDATGEPQTGESVTVPADTSDSPGADAPRGDVPVVEMPDLGVIIEIAPIEFDPCAGPSADAGPVDGIATIIDDDGIVRCEGGITGTIAALGMLPQPEPVVVAGHALEPRVPGGPTCPSTTPPPTASQAAFTVWTSTPLSGLLMSHRPHGTSVASSEVLVDIPAGYDTEWRSRWETETYDDTWGRLPLCGVIDVDPGRASTLGGFASDVFDRTADIRSIIIRPTDTGARPPTTGRIAGVSPTAVVSAWTTTDGSVTFTSRSITDDADSLDCPAGRVDPARVGSRIRQPYPNVYDERFDQEATARIPMMTGGRLLVCAEIFDTDNPLIPLVTDRLLLEAPTQPRPVVSLRYIDNRDFDETEPLVVSTGAMASGRWSEGCDQWIAVPAIPDREARRIDQSIWECSGPMTTLDSNGELDVALQIEHGGQLVVDTAIPIDAADCRSERCPQRTEWYEVPIPAPDQTPCRSLQTWCHSPDDIDAVAAIKVSYPVVIGAGGRAGRVTELDAVDTSVLADTPRFTDVTATRFEVGSDLVHWDTTLEFQSDRPLRAALEVFGVSVGERCAGPVMSEQTVGFATDFSVVLPDLCAGEGYFAVVHAEDEAGRRWEVEIRRGFVIRGGPSAEFDVAFSFVGNVKAPDRLHLETANVIGTFYQGFTHPGRVVVEPVLLPSSQLGTGRCYDVNGSYANQPLRVFVDTEGALLTTRFRARDIEADGTCTTNELGVSIYRECTEFDRNRDGQPDLSLRDVLGDDAVERLFDDDDNNSTEEELATLAQRDRLREGCESAFENPPRRDQFAVRIPFDALAAAEQGETVRVVSASGRRSMQLAVEITRTSPWRDVTGRTLPE